MVQVSDRSLVIGHEFPSHPPPGLHWQPGSSTFRFAHSWVAMLGRSLPVLRWKAPLLGPPPKANSEVVVDPGAVEQSSPSSSSARLRRRLVVRLRRFWGIIGSFVRPTLGVKVKS